MTDSTPLKDLQGPRNSLIAERRNCARLSMENFEAGREEQAAVSWGTKIKIIQEEIDAIDRAIAHEGRNSTQASRLDDKTDPSPCPSCNAVNDGTAPRMPSGFTTQFDKKGWRL